jgi:hypothetical protein
MYSLATTSPRSSGPNCESAIFECEHRLRLLKEACVMLRTAIEERDGLRASAAAGETSAVRQHFA